MSEQKAIKNTRRAYLTDLTDAQWDILCPLLPPAVPKKGCEPTDLREVMNTLLYQNKTGCQWSMLPHDLLPKSTVFGYFQKWQDTGVWAQLVEALRGQVRQATPREVRPEPVTDDATPAPDMPAETPAETPAGPRPEVPPTLVPRDETPSFVLMDSQSVKTTEVGGEQRGYDGGKKVKGRKRHIAVDTLGMLVAVVVTAANVSDGRGACSLRDRMPADRFPRLQGACGDGRYNDKNFLAALQKRGLTLEVKSRPPGTKGFRVIAKRWIVERTFAWLGFQRRLSKDYELTVAASEARVQMAAAGMMLRRLTTKKKD